MKQIYNMITINYFSLVSNTQFQILKIQRQQSETRQQPFVFGKRNKKTNQREANSWILYSSLTKEEAGQPSASTEYPFKVKVHLDLDFWIWRLIQTTSESAFPLKIQLYWFMNKINHLPLSSLFPKRKPSKLWNFSWDIYTNYQIDGVKPIMIPYLPFPIIHNTSFD